MPQTQTQYNGLSKQTTQPMAAAFETLEPRQLLSAAPATPSPLSAAPSALFQPARRATRPPVIGSTGDSFTDEYQFYRVRDAGRNWVEQLASNGAANFGAFSSTPRKDERGAGYAYNWGVSGAVADDLAGQINGLLPQVKSGAIQYVTIFMGGNDFEAGVVASHANATLRALPRHVLGDIEAAVATVLNASPTVGVVIATLEQLEQTPRLEGLVSDGSVSPRTLKLADAEQGVVNTAVKKLARHSPRIAIADYAAHLDAATQAGGYDIGDVHVTVNANSFSADPHDSFLADGEHLGTIEQGILADLFIDAINVKFGQNIIGLSDAQILADAGLS